MDTKLYFEKWSEKLSIPIEDIESEFQELVKNEQIIHVDLTEEQQNTQALKRLAMIYKKQLRSPAIGFEGMIIAVGDAYDVVKKLREAGMDAFRENPHTAIEQGITDTEGVPLDTREIFGTGRANTGFGKPLPEHSYIRNVIGIALRTNTEDKPKMFSMTLNGALAENPKATLFEPIKFRAINKSDDTDDTFVLNGSSVTRFEVSDKVKMPAPIDVLKKFCADKIVPIAKLEEYHGTVKDDFNRLALIEGDVSILGTEPTSVGSTMMVIDDMNASMEDIATPGVTCWIPKNIQPDFAEGSKVIVIGRTAQGKSRDNPDELGDVMVNVLGVYAIPEYKIDAEVLEVNAELTPEEVEKINTPTPGFDEAPKAEEPAPVVAEADKPKEEVQTDLNTGW